MAFAENLAQLRARRGQSQRAAATGLNISQSLLSHYENGARQPGLGFVVRACEYYGVTADYLLGRSVNDTPLAGGRLEAALKYLKESLAESGGLRDAVERYLTIAAYKMVAVMASDPNAAALTALEAQLTLSELAVINSLAQETDVPVPHLELRRDMTELVAAAQKSTAYIAYDAD